MRFPVSEARLLERYEGKSVALVGAADSITGTGSGPEIDAHDIVVRVNNGFLYPGNMIGDIGARTDFVYHTGVMNTSDGTGRFTPIENSTPVGVRNIELEDVTAMEKRGVRCLVFVVGPGSQRIQRFMTLGDSSLQWCRFARDYRTDLSRHMGTLPNTGVVTAWHILQSQASRLDLYGFDFFTTSHFPGYNRETEAYRLTAGSRVTDRPHRQEPQVDLIGQLWSTDHRLNLPLVAETKVRERGWNRLDES